MTMTLSWWRGNALLYVCGRLQSLVAERAEVQIVRLALAFWVRVTTWASADGFAIKSIGHAVLQVARPMS